MLSSRTQYATRALLDLTLHPNKPVQSQDIAGRQNIPVKFLEQILLALKREGYVQSRKGPGGGYTLAVKPENLTLGAVVRAMDGPLAPVSCVSITNYRACGCPDPMVCGLRTAWKEARDAFAEVLDRTNFADIAHRQQTGEARRDIVLDYVI